MSDRTAPRHTNDSPIAKARINAGLTQSQLAELIGTTQQVIAKWENGISSPRVATLKRLAEVLKADITDLI